MKGFTTKSIESFERRNRFKLNEVSVPFSTVRKSYSGEEISRLSRFSMNQVSREIRNEFHSIWNKF